MKFILIILSISLISCKAAQPKSKRVLTNTALITMSNAQQTAAIVKSNLDIERNRTDIDSLKSFITFLDSSIFQLRGNVATFKDSIVLNIVVVKRLYVGVPDTIPIILPPILDTLKL